MGDVSGIVPGSGEGTDGGDEEYKTVEAEQARAASELAAEHLDSKAGKLGLFVKISVSSLGKLLGGASGSAAPRSEHSARAE